MQAKAGDKVRVHYTGRLADGTVFDSSQGADPIEFVLGEGAVIPGFDRGVTGMTVGETRTIEIPHLEAYGPHQPEAIVVVPREQFPPDVDPEVGMVLRMMHPSGIPIDMAVVEKSPADITLDGNHPLAGKDLTFDLELVSVA